VQIPEAVGMSQNKIYGYMHTKTKNYNGIVVGGRQVIK
jgi:hypothetical protein